MADQAGRAQDAVAPRTGRAWGIAVASFVAAFLTWVLQAFAGRLLGPSDFAHFMVVWGFAFFLIGLLQGLQQEVTRSVTSAGRPGARQWHGQLVRTAGGVAGAGALLLLASSPLWGPTILGGSWFPIALATAAGFAAYSALNVTNGAVTGQQRWTDYAWSLAVEGALRFAVVIAVVAAGAGLVGQSWALVAGGLAWLVIAGRRGVRAALRAPTDQTALDLVRRSGHAMVATGCSAILLAGFPVLLSVTSDGPLPAAAGVLIAAIVATRAPLLLPLNAFQALILNRFVLARERILAELARLLLLVAALTLVGALAAAAAGPLLLRLLYGGEFVIGSTTISLLVVAAGLLTVQTLCGVAVVAVDRHLLYAAGWLAATVVAAALLLLDLPVGERALIALLASPFAGITVHLLALRGAGRHPEPAP